MNSVPSGKHRRKSAERPADSRADTRFFLRVGRYFLPYRRLAVAAIVALVAGETLTLVPPLLIREFIDHGLPTAQAGGPEWPVFALAAALVVCPILAGVIGLVREYLTTRVGQSILFDIRDQLLGRLFGQSIGFYQTVPAGEIVARVFDDVGAVRTAVTDTLVEFATNLVVVLGTLVVLVVVSPTLGLAAAMTLPLFLIPTRIVTRWRKGLTAEIQARQATMQARLFDLLNVGGVVLMRSFGREADERKRFREIGTDLLRLRLRQAIAGRILAAATVILAAVGPAVVYGYGGLLVVRGEISLGTVVAFVAYLTNVYRPVTRLAAAYSELNCGSAVFHRIFEFLDRPQEILERPGAVDLQEVAGELQLDGVRYTYPGAPRSAVDGISFRAKPGQLVALVGPSGAGKSTTLSLLARFADPSEGTVRLDGHDLRDLTLASLSRHFGLVSQDSYLFHGTVRENLRYARPDATEEELVAACRAAQIHDVLTALPAGYDTVVGERGVKFSRGERQRLAIARVLLKNPRVLLLDEATSSLDSVSERAVQEALSPLLAGRTTIAVAHRLSTILAADQILVLENGRLVEAGPHPVLLQAGGLYSRLYREQFDHPDVSTSASA